MKQGYAAMSVDVPGLVAEGRSVVEAVEITRLISEADKVLTV